MGSSPQWDLLFLIFLLGAVMISGTRTCNSWDAISDMESPTISRGTGAIYSCDEIVLMGAPLGDSGAAILAKMISGTTHVKTLSLSYVSMSAAGARALASALPLSRLTSLVINGDDIGDDGAVSIADALRDPRTSLSLLELYETGITSRGAEAISQALYSFDKNDHGTMASRVGGSMLTHLSLFGNSIQDEGASALGAALEFNRPLESLDLGGNAISSTGATAIARGLAKSGEVNAFCQNYDKSYTHAFT